MSKGKGNKGNAGKEAPKSGGEDVNLESGHEGNNELRPDTAMDDDFNTKICIKGDKAEIIDSDDANLIVRGIGEVVNSEDMIEAQLGIHRYETGFLPLYRTLNRIINLAMTVEDADNEVLMAAFKDIKKKIDDGNGIRNIGKPKLSKIDEEYVAKLKAEPCRHLLSFLFPNADPSLRSKYHTIISWAKSANRHNFVDWISNEIVYQGPKEDVKCGKGIKGALKFVKMIEPKRSKVVSSNDKPVDFAKHAGDNSKIVIPKPEWIEKEMNNLMIFASVNGENLELYDITDTDMRHVEAAIKQRHATHFAAEYDYSEELNEQTMEQIQNIRKLIMPTEFLMWQDQWVTYIMPLYPTWVDDNGKVSHCYHLHYAIILDMSDIPEKGQDYDTTFPAVYGQDRSNKNSDVLKIGYATKEIDKIGKFDGDFNIEWTSDNMYSYKFMDALWETTGNRVYRQGKKDTVTGLCRGLSEPPLGFEYLHMSKFRSSIIISRDIDFDRARKEYKKWKDLQSSGGVKGDTDVVVVVENGVVGVWFSPIPAPQKKDEKQTYLYDGAFFEVGKDIDKRYRGKWCIPEKRIERIWNFISHPWELLIPGHTEDLLIGEGATTKECLSFDEALLVMEANKEKALPGDDRLTKQELKDKHYMRLIDLCSDKEVGKEYVADGSSFRVAGAGEKGKRLCLPFILKCGRIWLHLPTSQ